MTKQLTLAVIAVSYAASAAVYRKVPEPYFTNDPHQALPIGRAIITFLLPTAAALTCGLVWWLSRRDPVRERSASFEATFRALVFRIVLLIIVLHAVVLASLVSGRNLAPRAVPVLLGLAVIAIGDVLPRLRPNIAIGLRTQATFASRGVWMRTHRFAGYATVSLGSVIIISVVLPPRAGEAAILAAGGCGAIALVWYSRRISRSVEGGRE